MTDRDDQLHFRSLSYCIHRAVPNMLDPTNKKPTPNISGVARNLKNMPRTTSHHYYFNSSLKFLVKASVS